MLVSSRNADADAVQELYSLHPYPKPLIENDELEHLEQESTRAAIRARVSAHTASRNSSFAAKHRLAGMQATRGAGLRILDAGCGTGVLTAQLASLLPEAEITAIDLCDASLFLARTTMEIAGFANVTVQKANLMDPDSLPRGYDHVFSLGVVHVTPDPARVLENLAGVLVPGGAITTFVYNMWGRKLESLLNRFTVTLARNEPALKERIIRSFSLDRNAVRAEDTVLDRIRIRPSAARWARALVPPIVFDELLPRLQRLRGRTPRGRANWNGNWDAFAHPLVHFFDVESYWEIHERAGLRPLDVWFGGGSVDYRGLLESLLRERGMQDFDVDGLTDREVWVLAECVLTPRQLFFRGVTAESPDERLLQESSRARAS